MDNLTKFECSECHDARACGCSEPCRCEVPDWAHKPEGCLYPGANEPNWVKVEK